MTIQIEIGDILGYSGMGILGKTIKWFEKGYHETPSVLSHCGLFANEGSPKNVNIIEALFPKGVTYRRFWHASKDDLPYCYILKPLNLNIKLRLLVIRVSMQYVGDPYGTLKIIPHALDGLMAKAFRKRDFRLFRTLCKIDTFPICSYLVAKSYAILDLDFGIQGSMATPDDIWDFALQNPDKYEIIQIK